MDEYLSEKEQIARIREWWSDYGWYLLGGAAIGLLAIFGYNRWQAAVTTQAESAAALYGELAAAIDDDDVEAAERVLGTLRSEYAGSPYTYNGELLLASEVLVSDPDRAIEVLRTVMNGTADEDLSMIARLRLARVLTWQERYDEAAALLDVDEAGPFSARMADIRGDIALARGDRDGALAAYTSALLLPGSDVLDRSYLQMKATSLLVSESDSATAAAEVLPEVDLDAAAAPVGPEPAAASETAAEDAAP